MRAPRAIREFPYTGDPWPVVQAWAERGRYAPSDVRPCVRTFLRKRWWSMHRNLLVISADGLLHLEAWLSPTSLARGSVVNGVAVPDEITAEPGGWMGSTPRHHMRKEMNRLLVALGAQPISDAKDPKGAIWASLEVQIADAGVLRRSGRLDDAMALWRRILPIAERLFGSLHGITLTGRLELAVAELDAGATELALAELQKIVPNLELVVGPDALWTLNAKESLAVALALTGNEIEARDLAGRTVEDLERVLGHGDPRAQKAKRNFHRRDWSTGRLPAS